jgi:hypothetical protein
VIAGELLKLGAEWIIEDEGKSAAQQIVRKLLDQYFASSRTNLRRKFVARAAPAIAEPAHQAAVLRSACSFALVSLLSILGGPLIIRSSAEQRGLRCRVAHLLHEGAPLVGSLPPMLGVHRKCDKAPSLGAVKRAVSSVSLNICPGVARAFCAPAADASHSPAWVPPGSRLAHEISSAERENEGTRMVTCGFFGRVRHVSSAWP